MSMVEWKKDGTVAIMIMNNSENRQNLIWCEAMLAIYDEILADREIKALVLTSSDAKNFSQGVDIDWMNERLGVQDIDSVAKWIRLNFQVFRSMLMAPFPTIAAINGHAFGNGAILAGACDFRFMRADRGFFCLPEVDVELHLTPSELEWMKRIIPQPLFTRMTLSGEKIKAPELEKYEVIIKACESAEATVAEALAYAKTFNKSRSSMAELKKRAHKHITDKMDYEDAAYFDFIIN